MEKTEADRVKPGRAVFYERRVFEHQRFELDRALFWESFAYTRLYKV